LRGLGLIVAGGISGCAVTPIDRYFPNQIGSDTEVLALYKCDGKRAVLLRNGGKVYLDVENARADKYSPLEKRRYYVNPDLRRFSEFELTPGLDGKATSVIEGQGKTERGREAYKTYAPEFKEVIGKMIEGAKRKIK